MIIATVSPSTIVSLVSFVVIVGSARTQPPMFRASTRLVEVSVVVHDRDGRPVADLTRADFELLEDGQPQSIEIFSVQNESAPSPDSPLRPATRDTVQTGEVSPGEVSNWRDRQGTSVTVILIDRINSRDVDQALVRKQVVAFLEQARPPVASAINCITSPLAAVAANVLGGVGIACPGRGVGAAGSKTQYAGMPRLSTGYTATLRSLSIRMTRVASAFDVVTNPSSSRLTNGNDDVTEIRFLRLWMPAQMLTERFRAYTTNDCTSCCATSPRARPGRSEFRSGSLALPL